MPRKKKSSKKRTDPEPDLCDIFQHESISKLITSSLSWKDLTNLRLAAASVNKTVVDKTTFVQRTRLMISNEILQCLNLEQLTFTPRHILLIPSYKHVTEDFLTSELTRKACAVASKCESISVGLRHCDLYSGFYHEDEKLLLSMVEDYWNVCLFRNFPDVMDQVEIPGHCPNIPQILSVAYELQHLVVNSGMELLLRDLKAFPGKNLRSIKYKNSKIGYCPSAFLSCSTLESFDMQQHICDCSLAFDTEERMMGTFSHNQHALVKQILIQNVETLTYLDLRIPYPSTEQSEHFYCSLFQLQFPALVDLKVSTSSDERCRIAIERFLETHLPRMEKLEMEITSPTFGNILELFVLCDTTQLKTLILRVHESLSSIRLGDNNIQALKNTCLKTFQYYSPHELYSSRKNYAKKDKFNILAALPKSLKRLEIHDFAKTCAFNPAHVKNFPGLRHLHVEMREALSERTLTEITTHLRELTDLYLDFHLGKGAVVRTGGQLKPSQKSNVDTSTLQEQNKPLGISFHQLKELRSFVLMEKSERMPLNDLTAFKNPKLERLVLPSLSFSDTAQLKDLKSQNPKIQTIETRGWQWERHRKTKGLLDA